MKIAACILLLGLASSVMSQQTEVIGTHYSNREVIRRAPKEQQVFIASTCQHFDKFSVNVGLQLFHNPNWIVEDGVVRFYVTDVAPVDGKPLSPDSILCSNSKSPDAKPTPNCTVTSWKGSAKELFVVAINGDVGGIAYSILVQFGKPKTTVFEGYSRKSNKTYVHPDMRELSSVHDPIYLAQSVRSTLDISVPMGSNILLTVAFCPDKETTKHYQITSTIIARSVHGAFNQYICRGSTPASKCHPDGSGVIGSDPYQMPINAAAVVTAVGDLGKLSVRIYCWGGDKQSSGQFVGRFIYGAALDTL